MDAKKVAQTVRQSLDKWMRYEGEDFSDIVNQADFYAIALAEKTDLHRCVREIVRALRTVLRKKFHI